MTAPMIIQVVLFRLEPALLILDRTEPSLTGGFKLKLTYYAEDIYI